MARHSNLQVIVVPEAEDSINVYYQVSGLKVALNTIMKDNKVPRKVKVGRGVNGKRGLSQASVTQSQIRSKACNVFTSCCDRVIISKGLKKDCYSCSARDSTDLLCEVRGRLISSQQKIRAAK